MLNKTAGIKVQRCVLQQQQQQQQQKDDTLLWYLASTKEKEEKRRQGPRTMWAKDLSRYTNCSERPHGADLITYTRLYPWKG